jgi:ABC-type polysaccharide/polyol phosphate transport system ATPase subunit
VIDNFRDSGVTILFVTHSLAQIRTLCDKVMWLDGGKVRAWGDAPDVLDQYEASMSG